MYNEPLAPVKYNGSAIKNGVNVTQTIGQLSLLVRDYDEAIHFYVNQLGFSLVEDTAMPAQDKRWVVVAPPGKGGLRLLREPKDEVYGTVAVFKDLYGNLWDLVHAAT